MAIMINSQNVDASYSNKLEANLYYNETLVPGITCDDSYVVGPAGGIYVHKLATSAVEPSTPGADFTDVETSDSLIPIMLNNSFRRSRKVYNVQAAEVSADLKDANLSAAQSECREGWMLAGIACLVKEGTAKAITSDSPVNAVIDARTEIVNNKGTADVVLCSPAFYAKVLKAAGKDFTPVANDRIKSSGNVGVYLGMTWIEANGMVSTAAKYYTSTGNLQTVDLSGKDFVVYNHATLSVLTNINMARMVDSEMFNGCKAQVEMNAGYRVRNANLAIVGTYTEAS